MNREQELQQELEAVKEQLRAYIDRSGQARDSIVRLRDKGARQAAELEQMKVHIAELEQTVVATSDRAKVYVDAVFATLREFVRAVRD